jgi:hypothetical protein
MMRTWRANGNPGLPIRVLRNALPCLSRVLFL